MIFQFLRGLFRVGADDYRCDHHGRSLNPMKTFLTESQCKSEIWRFAEAIAVGHFRVHFLRKHRRTGAVTWENTQRCDDLGLPFGKADYTVPKYQCPEQSVLEPVCNGLDRHFRNTGRKYPGGVSHKNRETDGLGLSSDGREGELVEVTTDGSYRKSRKKRKQLDEQLQILREHLGQINWQPADSASRPKPNTPWPFYSEGQVSRWVCFRPTYRRPHPGRGWVLYEVHEKKDLERNRYLDWLKILLGVSLLDSLKEEVPKDLEKFHGKNPEEKGPLEWGEDIAKASAILLKAVQLILVMVASIALAVVLTAILLELLAVTTLVVGMTVSLLAVGLVFFILQSGDQSEKTSLTLS